MGIEGVKPVPVVYADIIAPIIHCIHCADGVVRNAVYHLAYIAGSRGIDRFTETIVVI
ncbi:hypothetical protein DSECCO2_578550 [anaerobic digester metagenome]